MRVLVVTNMFPTAAEPWFGSFVRDQVQDLRGLGLEVDVHTFDGRARKLEYARAVRTIRGRLRTARWDVVHAHYGLTGAVAALARPAIPVVTTFHGSDYCGPRWQRAVSVVTSRASTAIVVSDEGRRRLFAPEAAVIPMGVDTERFVPLDREVARQTLGWDPHGRYALLAGSRRNPIKRADLFDAAVELARHSDGALRGVALEGFDRDGVVQALNAADVLVVASDHEGSPLTVREALACATPVVSVEAGDVPAAIADLPGCAVVERAPEAIAVAIHKALRAGRDERLRQRAGLTSRIQIAERVRDLYQSLTEPGV